jgi:arabinogalactan oligomer/maltooligosaccharide transport system substrate-binding protein
MKRLLFHKVFLVLVLGTLLLQGCQSPLSPSPLFSSPSPLRPTPLPTELPSKITLTVWHSWDEDQEDLFQGYLADYQRQHPGVMIRLQRVPVDRILSEYEEAVLAGEGPDLLAGRSHWIGRLAEGQVIAPLEGIVPQETWNLLYPFALDGVRYQDHLYAFPYACETVALYYNRDFVTEPPTTTSAMLELAAVWPGEGQSGLAFPLSFYNTVGYLYAFGGRLLDEEGHTAIGSPESEAWLAWLQEVRSSPGVVAANDYGQADTLFKRGSVAMVVNGSWALADYVRALGAERLAVARLPMLDQTQSWPTPLVGYRAFMVNPVQFPEHPQETLELLGFLGGSIPQRQAAGSGVIPTLNIIDLSTSELLTAFFQQVEAGRPRPVSPPMQAIWEPMKGLLDNVTSGRVPIDLALQETRQQIEQALLEMEETTP